MHARGLPPKVDPCSPGWMLSMTSSLDSTADTGITPPDRALPVIVVVVVVVIVVVVVAVVVVIVVVVVVVIVVVVVVGSSWEETIKGGRLCGSTGLSVDINHHHHHYHQPLQTHYYYYYYYYVRGLLLDNKIMALVITSTW